MTSDNQKTNNHPIKVFFDMDGTLLDLAFDNYIWLEQMPILWAKQTNSSFIEAKDFLYNFYLQYQGTLEWYSTKFWHEKTGIDVLRLQQEHQQRIKPREGCFQLLEALKQREIECWLVTNADRYTLDLKLKTIDMQGYFTQIISSDVIGYPKENLSFWQKLQQQYPFESKHVYFLDDNYAVLQTAKDFGIQQVISIDEPDSQNPRKNWHDDFIHLQYLTDFLKYID